MSQLALQTESHEWGEMQLMPTWAPSTPQREHNHFEPSEGLDTTANTEQADSSSSVKLRI